MFTSEGSFRSILASDPVIVFDTNIYLDLLRLSKNTGTELLRLYRTIIDDLRIPAQVHKELDKNIPIVSARRTSELKTVGTKIKNIINNSTADVRTQLDFFLRYKFTNASIISDSMDTEFGKIKTDIADYIDGIIKKEDSFLSVSDVTAFLDYIWNAHTSEPYKPSKLMSIYQDGSIRYRYKIPPGYMDDPQNNKESKKDGTDIFGDLVLWHQVLDYGCTEHRTIVFVTADVKEDWFILDNKRPKSPREELLNEFSEKTDGVDICILTSELFVEYLSNIKAIDTSEALLEMQMDDYVDIAIRNNKESIFQAFLLWGNDLEHILQFPFYEDINTLLRIDNARYVVKSSSLQLKEKIEYSIVLEGVADFWGVNFDKVMKCNTSKEIQSSFQFDLRISFLRPYQKDARGNCIPLGEVENIQITNAILEAVPSTDILLESRRGVFILPTEEDKEIYEYMESILDAYSETNSVDKAEALAYFDAAEHFHRTLLEVNRAYTLVQNSKSKSMLSLNEMDALAIKRFSDIKILVRDGIATYGKKSVPIGDAYPIPESMNLLPPEEGNEISVAFDVSAILTDEQHIVFTGTTTLPSKTQLMMTLYSPMHKYHAQSKTAVGEDRTFRSEQFSNAQNPPKNEMLRGNYVLEIVVPIVSVQPEEVKLALGPKGRNLSGPHVDEDVVFGKTVHYKKDFSV